MVENAIGDKATEGASQDRASSTSSHSYGEVLDLSQHSGQNSLVEGIWALRESNMEARKVETFGSISRRPQHHIKIKIPVLSRADKEGYEFLPGHFSVSYILSETNGKYLVKLQSGEVEWVQCDKISVLGNSAEALEIFFNENEEHPRRARRKAVVKPSQVDWAHLGISDSGSEQDLLNRNRRKRRKMMDDDSDDILASTPSDIGSSTDNQGDDGDSYDFGTFGRRSSRLQESKRQPEYITALQELGNSDAAPSRRTQRRGFNRSSSNHSHRLAEGARRSQRARNMPRRAMRERQEDDISSATEEDIEPKIVTVKEQFSRIPPDNPFRRRHRQECDTCGFKGDSEANGPLVFCQGCTNSHHKKCLGPRGSRDHLVTKVGETLFVLQCRRCIGIAQEKDRLAPHHGHCFACNEPGSMSAPLRARLTTRLEQLQREENGGQDPITAVNIDLVNNISNVMFRCATCLRAWHMHHLPQRKTVDSTGEDESDLGEEQLAQKRFDHYHRSWVCKDCIENQGQIDALVAWRPVDAENYVSGTTITMLKEHEKEYLIKWRGQSYLRVTWMHGSWIWGVATPAMRISFLKKHENSLPKMTASDTIPEDFFRIDIVFDVRYSSVVRNSSREIDMVRAKEVETAFVKYKGLGYEDAIWEEPPTYSETERWNDFKLAYEDYVTKVYMGIPVQSTLRRHLLKVKEKDFEDDLQRREQPRNMIGGQLMHYQMEGLNWLYYQWFIGHNAILADEMGLGKTIQLVALFATLVQDHKCWPFLVVVPNSTCPNWRREIKKWAPSLRVVTYYGSERARKLTHDFELFPKDRDKDRDNYEQGQKKREGAKDIKAHIVVASYESIVEEKTRKSLMRVPWQALIVDEGQRLKNEKNLLYECLSRFTFPFKVLLTGTPLQNNAKELFTLLQFLDKSKNASELAEKYAELTEENISELHELLKPFFLRRTKVQVLTFLPPMAQIIVPVTMSVVQRKVYKSILAKNPHLMKSLFSRDGKLSGKERFNLNNILMQLRKTLCHPFVYSREIEERTNDDEAAHQGLVEASSKLQLLSVMLPKLQQRGHRVLLFSQFLDNLDVLEDFLDGMGMLHCRLDGSVNALEKQKRIDDFNAPGSPYFAFLLSTRAGGVGINLATADTVIILDPDFNPHQDIQALSRAHRIGQKSKVLVFQLMTKGSAEEKIMAIGKKKMALDHILIERMDQEEDAGENLESILKHGAAALFEDHDENDSIVYDSNSVDMLLDRSQTESTKTSDTQSGESQFSFARIWANDKAGFEEGLPEADTGVSTPTNLHIWDKILQEREQAYAEEEARKAERFERFGRGKRKRGNVDYNDPIAKGEDDRKSDDGEYDSSGDEDDESDKDAESTMAEDTDYEKPRKVRVRPFKRVKVPQGEAPYFNGDGPKDYIPVGGMPPTHVCGACGDTHSIGWCRMKLAGVEYCPVCGLAHLGHGRTCPHLNDEKQIEVALATLKQSVEPVEQREAATKYLQLIRGNLKSQRRAREQQQQQQNHLYQEPVQSFHPHPHSYPYPHPQPYTYQAMPTGAPVYYDQQFGNGAYTNRSLSYPTPSTPLAYGHPTQSNLGYGVHSQYGGYSGAQPR